MRAAIPRGSDDSIYATGSYLTKITTGTGPASLDADGLVDRKDRCRWLWSRHGDGCPRIRTSVVVKPAQPDHLRGEVISDSPACSKKVNVVIDRVTRKRPRLTRSARVTRGHWSSPGRLPAGIYVVRLKPHDRRGAGFCLGSVSRRVRLGLG